MSLRHFNWGFYGDQVYSVFWKMELFFLVQIYNRFPGFVGYKNINLKIEVNNKYLYVRPVFAPFTLNLMRGTAGA